jgi:hypothetical protein
MFTVGQKVVCIDAKFPLGVEKFYTALPVEGAIYTVRSMSVGVGLGLQEGEICVRVCELVNPKSSKPPFPERGFKVERFCPLTEITETESQPEREKIAA